MEINIDNNKTKFTTFLASPFPFPVLTPHFPSDKSPSNEEMVQPPRAQIRDFFLCLLSISSGLPYSDDIPQSNNIATFMAYKNTALILLTSPFFSLLNWLNVHLECSITIFALVFIKPHNHPRTLLLRHRIETVMIDSHISFETGPWIQPRTTPQTSASTLSRQ